MRRLHRGGEGQYLVNKTAVRRLDLVELLADLGLGQGMHSIIGQGKVEAILASKPEERRALIEEAAGLGRFKARRHRAELKLARVATQVERARDLEEEVKKRLRPLALQATAAERAEKLRGEIAELRARIAELDLETLDERLAEAGARKTAAGFARRAARRSSKRCSPSAAFPRGARRCAGSRASDAGARLGLSQRLGLRRESATAMLGTCAWLADAESTPAIEPRGRAARQALSTPRRQRGRGRRAREAGGRPAGARAAARRGGIQRAATQAKLDELLTRRATIKRIDGRRAGVIGARGVVRLRSRAARLAVRAVGGPAGRARSSPSRRLTRRGRAFARGLDRRSTRAPPPRAAHQRDTLAER
jgi:chromosome segregation protein